MIFAAVMALMFTSCHTSRKGISAVGKTTGKVVSANSSSRHQPQARVRIGSEMADPTRRLLAEANGWLGTPYKYGGNSKSGVDCSGMVCMVFDNALSIKLPRSSAQQGEWCAKIKKSDLQPGDLLFFTTRSGSKAISHVGMYIGDGNMIHASTSKGVIISSLNEDYYVRTYHSSGRVGQYHAMVSKSGKKAPRKENKAAAPVKVEEILIAKNTVSDAGTPGEATKAALEKQRAKLLDEVVEQKIDSIVSDFFD